MNYYLMPLKEIKGLSGFLCRTCNQLGFRPVRDIGFEMTKQADHKCDEEKVKSIKMCSCRKEDLLNTENFLVSGMFEFLNFCMPGGKYIVSEDVTDVFASLEKRLGLENAKNFFGIPNRLYFHSVGHGDMRDWIKRIIKNIGKKIMVEEFEIREFLMMVKSTYAMLELQQGETPRRIITSLTV